MSARQEIAGEISPSERRFLPDSVSATSARKHYTEVLNVAKAATKELLDFLLTEGVPKRVANPEYPNAFSGLAAVKCMQACRLINSFAWANTRLWMAAQQVCDVEELKDDGKEEGIVWEVAI